METKPYRIQSPEAIAKDYAGNKQKIAEAMQMGILDPTAGVLAGMFIDRMRSAQAQEAVPQQTVAQKVMGGAPSASSLPQAAGLGATAPASPPMAPSGGAGMTPQPQMAPPQGMAAGGEFQPPYMADGGLSELPLPDTMFDEHRDGGYAGGGIIAFADSGVAVSPSSWGDYIEETATSMFPGLQIASRGRTAAQNAQVGGVGNSFHLLNAARDLTTPPGMSKAEFIAKLKQAFGPDYDVLPSKGNSVHVEPGSKLSAGVRSGSLAPGAAPSRAAAPGAAPAVPWGGSLESKVPGAYKYAEEFYSKNIPTLKNEGAKLLEAEARKTLDPEEQKKRRNEDKWATLAQIGFNMAASNSPYLLQAAGAAAAAALPGARADKKERQAEKRQAIRDLAEVEGITYKQAMDKANYVREVAKERLDISKDDIARLADQQKTVYTQGEETKRTGMQIQGSKDVATINAKSYSDYADKQDAQLKKQAALKAPEEARARIVTDPDYIKARDAGDTKEMNRLLRKHANDYYFEVTGENLPSMKPPASGKAGAQGKPTTNSGPKEGQRAKATDGRDIIYRNGQWVFVSPAR